MADTHPTHREDSRDGQSIKRCQAGAICRPDAKDPETELSTIDSQDISKGNNSQQPDTRRR